MNAALHELILIQLNADNVDILLFKKVTNYGAQDIVLVKSWPQFNKIKMGKQISFNMI